MCAIVSNSLYLDIPVKEFILIIFRLVCEWNTNKGIATLVFANVLIPIENIDKRYF